jgi:putative NADPH-quinone reductase
MKVIALQGSARVDGNTTKLLKAMFAGHDVEIVHVAQAGIRPYDYAGFPDDDPVLALGERMGAADVVVFATPVFWYSMSAQLKALFDRFSDLKFVRKEIGQKLGGRVAWLVASGFEAVLPEGFEVPFRRTCEFVGMDYRGAFYGMTNPDSIGFPPEVLKAANDFGQHILAGGA